MPSLSELQRDFLRDLFAGHGGAIAPCLVAGRLPAEAQIGIYNNNVFANLREALRDIYPVIERLLGEEFFRHAANQYIRQFPSTSGDIGNYGEKFAEFLAEFPGAADLIYLPDVARLEWAWHGVFHAPDHAPLSMESLARADARGYARLRFKLHPASALLKSRYPIHRIWEVNQPQYNGEAEVELAEGGVMLLVIRVKDAIELRSLNDGEFTMLERLGKGDPIGEAYESTARAAPGFDLSSFLQKHVASGTLVDFSGA